MKHALPIQIIGLFSIWISTSSCSTSGPIVEEYNETASPSAEVASFETSLQTAKTDQMNVLAPRNFREARERLESAKKKLTQEKPAKDTLHEVAVGRAYLKRAETASKLAHEHMEDVVSARRDALKADAPRYEEKEFAKADAELIDLTEDVEKNKLGNISKERSKLQARYMNIEIKALKEANLRTARENIEVAIREGAKEYAPRTLAAAQKDVTDTEAFINANRHQSEQIASRAEEARQSAAHALKITRDSKTGKHSSEDAALLLERTQDRVSDTEGRLLREKRIATNLSRENRTMEQEQEFKKNFDTARALFSPQEAEVYQQGNTLVIRLKGLEFPTGQAVLKKNNFPLLAKVKEVIEHFDESSVVVEGHTDSIGGKQANERLSTNRAAAVKEYFVSNVANRPLEIESVGYGYQKPIASNKTSTGRAQNRRVDVLIHAESPAHQ